jgi:hypothetical protein
MRGEEARSIFFLRVMCDDDDEQEMSVSMCLCVHLKKASLDIVLL